MMILLLAAILGWAGQTGAVEEAAPGTEAADEGNPGTTGRGGDVLTPGSEKDLSDRQRLQRAHEQGKLTPGSVEATGTDVRPGLKPAGWLAAGVLVAALGFTVGRRRRHRGRGAPPGPKV